MCGSCAGDVRVRVMCGSSIKWKINVAVESAGRVRVIFMCGSCAGHSSDSECAGRVRVISCAGYVRIIHQMKIKLL